MTTFAPVSHDADRHDLASHTLPPSNGDVPTDARIAEFPPHQNGIANGDEKHNADQADPDHQADDDIAMSAPVKSVGEPQVTSVPAETSPSSNPAPVSSEPNPPAVTGVATVQPSIETEAPDLPNPPAASIPPETATVPPESPQPDTPREQPAEKDIPLHIAQPPALDAPSSILTPAPTAPQDDQEMTDVSALVSKTTREREDDDESDGPSAKRARTDVAKAEDAAAPAVSAEPSAPADPVPAAVAPATSPLASSNPPPTAAPSDPVPVVAPAANGTEYAPPSVPPLGPLTEIQKKRLLDGMRNLKKSKHAAAFSRPVDPVALNLPTYTSIVTEPMDLSTMEQKMKDDQYASADDYIDDFNKMVRNAMKFNGQQHPVAQAGSVLRSQLQSQLSKLPKLGDKPQPLQPKKPAREAAPAFPRDAARRAARPSTGTANANTNQSPVATLDGAPIIRRGSNLDDRPKRKIQKPAPRDLSYAKTPKKRFQGELKFANEVLTEMTRPRYHGIAGPFLQPVDPVALGIPNYFKTIKKPMDVSTISERLSGHQYENLKEFEGDFRQMFWNCFKFNPAESDVHQMGKQYEDIFNSEMKKKEDRLAVLAPASAAQSPVGDSDEDDEPEEDEAENERMEKIRQLNEQVAAIQQQAQELMAGNWAKPKKEKSKGGKGTKQRKSGGSAAVPARAEKKAPKSKAKKQKPLTASQKQEIAERIGELPTEEINRVADQIKASLRKAGKPVPPDDEMEFQIDDIPDDLLHELLIKVRKIGPHQAKDEDDDFASPPAPTRAPKGKKNKPMTKSEQEAQINRLEGQLKTFQGGEPGMFQDEVKDEDDESSEDESGSESEEE